MIGIPAVFILYMTTPLIMVTSSAFVSLFFEIVCSLVISSDGESDCSLCVSFVNVSNKYPMDMLAWRGVDLGI